MDKLNLRVFLEAHGWLESYIRCLLEEDSDWLDKLGCAGGFSVHNPESWIGHAFQWRNTEEGYLTWRIRDQAWGCELSRVMYHRPSGMEDAVEPGMPLFDRLGMALLLEELCHER